MRKNKRFLLLCLLSFFLTNRNLSAQQSVRIDPGAFQKDNIISPLLFGQNLEVTRKGFWGGLSAEMIANRKFAAGANGQPLHWQGLNPGDIQSDSTVVFAGKKSVRVINPKGGPAGLRQQQEWLSFQQGKKYALRIWIRTSVRQKIQVKLQDSSGRLLYHRSFDVDPEKWFLIRDNFIEKNTQRNCAFSIGGSGKKAFYIGAVSMLPADAFHGMRSDVIAMLKKLKPGCLRFPGGCYAEFYSWKDGLLPVDKRPPIEVNDLDFLLPYTDHIDNQEAGIDDFIALCRKIGAEPIITARLNDNEPNDIADWVEYCNGGPATQWGKRRAQRGYTTPFHVSRWFVGNELAYFGRANLATPEGAAAASLSFSRAMKAVDKNIQLVASTRFESGQVFPRWNDTLLHSTAGLIRHVSVHQYMDDQQPLNNFSDYKELLRFPVENTLTMFRDVRRYCDSIRGNSTTGIVFDEWNTKWGQAGNIPMALYSAAMLNMLCRESVSLGLDMACYFMPVNEGAIRVDPLSARLDAAGLVFELYAVHQGNLLLPVLEPDSIDVCVSLSPDHRFIFITAVNGIDSSRDLRFSLVGQGDHILPAASVKSLTPRSLSLQETLFQINERTEPIKERNQLNIRMQPGEVARIKIDLTKALYTGNPKKK